MNFSENIEDLIDSGRYIEALESLHAKKEAIQKDSAAETYDFWSIQNKIAEVLSKQGYYDKALNVFTDIIKTLAQYGDTYDQEIMAVKENIGSVFVDRRDYEHALSIFGGIYKYRCGALGFDNPLTFQALRNVAVTLSSAGRYEEAITNLTDIYTFKLNYFGFDHKSTLESSNDIAEVYIKQGEYDKALRIFEKTGKYLEHKRPQDWDTLLALCNTASVLKIQNKWDEAFKILGEVYLVQTKLKPAHPDTLTTLRSLAQLYELRGEDNAALLLLNKIYCVRSSECPMHPDTIDVERGIASVLLRQGKISSALHFFGGVLRKIPVAYGAHHPAAVEILKQVALELCSKEVFGEALDVFKAIYKTQCEMRHLGPDHPDTLLTKIYLGRMHLSLSDFSEAAKEFSDVLERVVKILGPHDADCLVAQKNIAEICKLQKKVDEAHGLNDDFSRTQSPTLQGLPRSSKARRNSVEKVHTNSNAVEDVGSEIKDVKFAVGIQEADVDARESSCCTTLHASFVTADTDVLNLLNKEAVHIVKKQRRRKSDAYRLKRRN